MPTLVYKNQLPSPEEFKQDVAQAMAATNPVDDLLELADELRIFEQTYNMRSEDFYLQYRAGALDDELQHCVEWAAAYRIFLKTKRMLESTLMRAAVQSPPFEAEIDKAPTQPLAPAHAEIAR